MDMFIKSFLMVFVLLNPFIMSIYMIEIVKKMDYKTFSHQMVRAIIISFVVFCLFAWAGDIIFTDILQIRFLAFLIFGGIIFLIIGIRLILGTGPAIEPPKKASDHVSASIAMPYIVGPGTISASVIVGTRLSLFNALMAILLALTLSLFTLLLFKRYHDFLQQNNEKLLQRYTEIAGRVTALFTGSFAIDMIIKGIESWLSQYSF